MHVYTCVYAYILTIYICINTNINMKQSNPIENEKMTCTDNS